MTRYQARAVRIRDELRESDGEARVLVDRVWPRGISKQQAHLDEWLKAVAPSTELRKWFNHDPEKFDEFRRHYRSEIDSSEEAKQAWSWLQDLADRQPVALLTGARDVEHSQAAALADRLNRMKPRS